MTSTCGPGDFKDFLFGATVSRRGRSLWLLSKKWREMGDSGGCDDVEVLERLLRLGIVCSFHRFLGGPAPGRPHTMPCAFHCMVANVSKALFCSVVTKKSAIFREMYCFKANLKIKRKREQWKTPWLFKVYRGLYYPIPIILGLVHNHHKDPYEPTSILKSKNVFFLGSNVGPS